MNYVDGYVLAVTTAKRAEYLEFARKAAPIFKEHGALSVVETWGDDVPDGKTTSFPMAVKCAADETVVFSWIVWPSRKSRDEGMEKVVADPRMQPDNTPMPFDGKRMIFGGFEVILEQ
jgi:uncharacterized protein YbaA (DUF1428 family)